MLNYYFTIACLIFASVLAFGQATTSVCDTIYTTVDQMPVPEKSYESILNYIQSVVVPQKCYADVMKNFTFIVLKDGKVTDLDMLGQEEECKAPYIRQEGNFPKFIPGKLNGHTVCVRMTMRVCIKTAN